VTRPFMPPDPSLTRRSSHHVRASQLEAVSHSAAGEREGAYGRRRPSVDGKPSATTFVGALIMLVLVTVSALALIAVSPTGIAAPMAMLLIGGLVGGIVAIRSRAT
jgi:hypothetical protein